MGVKQLKAVFDISLPDSRLIIIYKFISYLTAKETGLNYKDKSVNSA
jgi:hypothetical protein